VQALAVTDVGLTAATAAGAVPNVAAISPVDSTPTVQRDRAEPDADGRRRLERYTRTPSRPAGHPL
jgi:uncharacterized protein YcaQ